MKIKSIAASLALVTLGGLFGLAVSIPATEKIKWQDSKVELPYTVTIAVDGQYAQMRCAAPVLPPQVTYK